MGDGKDFVFLFFQRSFNFVESRTVANGGFELLRIDTISFETVSKGVGEVASVKNKNIISRFCEICSYEVPA